jgi:hypothetical protein
VRTNQDTVQLTAEMILIPAIAEHPLRINLTPEMTEIPSTGKRITSRSVDRAIAVQDKTLLPTGMETHELVN